MLPAVLLAVAARAQEPNGAAPAPGTNPPHGEPWNFSALTYWNMPREADNYVTGIVIAEHGNLHLEARANYEAMHAQSAFIGWTFAGGDTVQVKATPLIGFVAGSIHGPIAGLEAGVTVHRFDYYLEAEYLNEQGGRPGYLYAWSELGFRPREWLRLGVALQRTRIYGGERDLQRGGFVQLIVRKYTASFYWFNPGSPERILMLSLGVNF